MEFIGHNGQVLLSEDGIIITRKGALAFLTNGLKGDKSIPFSSITAVQFKKANMLTNGYIQFSVLGGIESRGGLFDATRDENSVMFRAGHQMEQFSRLKEIVEKRISESRGTQNSSPSVADEIEKAAALRDRGVLSEEEFQQHKKKLLGI